MTMKAAGMTPPENLTPADAETVEQLDGGLRSDVTGVAGNGAMNAKSLADAIPELHKVEDYTTFLAEFGIQEGDIIIHFFLPYEAFTGDDNHKEVKQEYDAYWQHRFPLILSTTAESYFDATYPRIFAEWIPELRSWYMRCRGFGKKLDPETYTLKFLEALDEALDKVQVPSS